MTRWQRLKGFVRPQLNLIIQAAGCLMVMACIQLAMPWAVKLVIDDVMPSQNTGLLWGILIGLLLLYTLRQVCFHISQYMIGYSTLHVVFDLRRALFRHLQRMSLRFYNERRTGQIVSRVINDVASVAQLVQQGSSTVITNIFVLIATLIIIFVIRWDLAIIACVVVPLYAFNFYVYRSRIRSASHDVRKKMAVITGNLTENISGVKVVKSFTGEGREDQAFVHNIKEHFGLGMRLRMITVKCNWIADYIRVIGVVMTIGYGTHLVIAGVMTVGEFVAFYSYLGMLYNPIIQLVTFATTIMGAVAGVDRVFEILEQEPDAEETAGQIKLDEVKGHVEFDGVSLSYDGKRPALREVSFDVKPGEVVALVGPSGSGKTSVANLIARFYHPTGGRLLLDGVDLTELDVTWYRRQIGLVLQENFLFSGSVIDNVRYGRPDATVQQVIDAAREANAEEFIQSLPERYDTEVGENGAALSGGQRQRIAIARALLKDPSLLILDEATSALDATSEELVQEALERLMKGRTTFIIAHRLSTIRNADKILVVVSGELAQVGTHEELLAQEGPYKDLYWPQIRQAKQLLAVAS